MNVQPCRVCGGRQSSKLFEKYGYGIVRCASCSLVFTDLNATPGFLKKYYSKSYFEKGDSKRSYASYQQEATPLQKTFKKRLALLDLPPKPRVLDVGCAYGYFLQVLPKGFQKYGLEVSAHATTIAQKNNRDAHIKNTFLSSKTFSETKFDLITLWDVIEHLNKPKDVLQVVYKKMKPGGALAMTTGDVSSLFARLQGKNWHLYNPPQHLSYFSPKTITRLLTNIGFSKIRISYPSSYYPLSYLLYKLKNLYKIPLPIPHFTQQVVLPFNLWDIMFITAKKK